MGQVGCNWGALLQLKLPFPERLSSRFLATPCRCAIQPLGGMPLLPRPAQQRSGGPRARKQVSTTTEPSLFRAAGQRRLQIERSKPPGTNAPGISGPASGKARRRFTMPCGYATFFLDPFHISKRTGPIKYCPAEKSNASNHTGFPMPRTSAPCFFLDLRGRFMPHMTISYIYEQPEGEGEPFPKAR